MFQSNADFIHLSATGTATLGGTGSHGTLYTVNVNTAIAAAAVQPIYRHMPDGFKDARLGVGVNPASFGEMKLNHQR